VSKTGLKFKNVILINISEFLPTIKKLIGKSILKEVYQKMAIPDISIYQQEGFCHFKDLIKQYPPSPPKVEIDPIEDILALQYTGGTTGAPKGVIQTHYNAIAGQMQFRAFYPSVSNEGGETLVGFVPFYHQGGQCGALLRSTLLGNRLVIITSPDWDEIINSMVRYKPSCFTGVPSIFESLRDYPKTNRVNWKKIGLVISGADVLFETTHKEWEGRTGAKIYDVWGMTECADFTIGNPLRKVKMGSIGVPFPSVMGAILDPDKDEFLPQGELGELVISGPAVTSKGYWGKPEATKDSESLIEGIRWWRTGDLARMDEDGYFFIYDRKRDLIKYKGLRIFAREVEEVLNTHPKIKEVGVIGVKNIKVGENVKAIVVLESDARGQLSEEDIINYCKGKLAPYKIPKIIEFVGEIPRTDIGKVSRRDIREEYEES
jgi:long-chain acyl-CoA synthetase